MSQTSSEEKIHSTKNLINDLSKINFKEFYPFRNKPKIILLIKKTIGYTVLFNMMLFFIASFLGHLLTKHSDGTKIYSTALKWGTGGLYLFVSIFMIFQMLQKPKYEKDKYKVSSLFVIFSIIYHIFWILFDGLKLNGWYFSLLTSNVQNLWIIYCLHFIIILIMILQMILMFILKPQIDREKIMLFQKELKKLAQANLKNEKYSIDFEKFK